LYICLYSHTGWIYTLPLLLKYKRGCRSSLYSVKMSTGELRRLFYGLLETFKGFLYKKSVKKHFFIKEAGEKVGPTASA
jgi:hypothetical protein